MSSPAALRETQAFFGARAAGWEERFPNDGPRYRQAILELAPRLGGRVLDVGCGTGRAIPLLRDRVGEDGLIAAVDVTPEMLSEASRLGRGSLGCLVSADGGRLPFRDGAFDAIFAAGFVPHLADPAGGLTELARVTGRGGRLAIFHPIGRAALAARHGGAPSDSDVTAPARLGGLLAAAGWVLESLDDGQDRYLALAGRR